MKDAGNQVGQPVLFHPAACSIDSTLFPLVFPFAHLPFPFLLLARNATAIFVTARDLISAINPMELNFPAAVDRGIIKSPRIVSCFAGHKRLFHAIVDSSFCNRYHFCPPSICLIHSPRVIHLTYILENLFIPILFESLFIDRRKTREPMNGTATRWYEIFAGNSLIINNYQLTIMVWKERERKS